MTARGMSTYLERSLWFSLNGSALTLLQSTHPAGRNETDPGSRIFSHLLMRYVEHTTAIRNTYTEDSCRYTWVT